MAQGRADSIIASINSPTPRVMRTHDTAKRPLQSKVLLGHSHHKSDHVAVPSSKQRVVST